jgi:hypothetical protein
MPGRDKDEQPSKKVVNRASCLTATAEETR